MGNLYDFTLKTGKSGFYNITKDVQSAVKESGVEHGIALIFCPHTTAAITLTENTDPAVGLDLIDGMSAAFPESEDFRHIEGNSHAYLQSCNMGVHLPIIIDDGWLLLGVWQNIFFVEFDGPRERTFYVKVIEC